MGLAKSNYIHLQNGKFAGTDANDLQAAFAQFASAPPLQGWAVHFHGGLVSHSSAIKNAERLFSEYQSAGAFPFFFVWESGLWETMRNNLQDISQEPFFKQLLSRLSQYILPKLGISADASESLESTRVTFDRVAEHIAGLGAPSFESTAQLDELVPLAPGLNSALISEKELEREFSGDLTLQKAFDDLNARVAGINRGLMSESLNEITGNQGILPSAAIRAELFDSRTAVSSPEESLSMTWLVRTAVVAARVGRRVITRLVSQRDHGWYTTIVEELLRELYVDTIGSTFFWKQMKKDTSDAFGGDVNQHGGSAFLDQLKNLTSNGPSLPRVTLIGHSAGAIFVSNFLLAAHQVLPGNFQFDVVLLAPAVDCELFSRAIDTNRIRNIRVFGMSDSLEAKDALLRPVSGDLSSVYPRSLLYFVSGLLETAVDLPLVAMQRYYDRNRYPGDVFPALRKVRGYLQHASDRQVWSLADDGAGRKCGAIHHGGFHDDPATLESVKHIVNQGFASTPGGLEISRESLESTLSGFSVEDLSLVVMELPEYCHEWFPLLKGTSESSRNSWEESEETRSASVKDLLDAAEKLPGGYLQLLRSAHRVKPQARLMQHWNFKGLQSKQKVDVVLTEAFNEAIRSGNRFSQENNALESVSTESQKQPVLICLREAGISLEGIEGLEVISKVGSVVAAKATQATVSQLNDDERIISLELSSPNAYVECHNSMPFIGVIDAVTKERRLQGEEGELCLIAVIDDDIDVLHEVFRDAGGMSRIVAVWDQRSVLGTAPPGLAGIGGTLHGKSDIDRYILAGATEKGLQRMKDGHGTHVASIATGTPLPHKGFPGGVAPKSPIAVVIADGSKFAPGAPASLGYSLSHNAALQFIETTATNLGLPVVVNLSQGMNSGAHDGTSLVERMFDDFSLGGGREGRVIVKSAGNDRDSNGHAFVTLNSNSLATLEWESLSPNPLKQSPQRQFDVIELWFDLLNELKFRLVTPSGENSLPVNWSNTRQTGTFLSGNTYSMTYEKIAGETADSRIRIELRNGAASAIEAGPKGVPANRPPWKLEISSGVLVTPAEIDAWIDRTDGLPIRFTGTNVSPDRTLSVPGTARSVISVGAIKSSLPLEVGPFSAFGKTRDGRKKPEVCAPGLNIMAAAGNTLDGIRAESGTSMAAPHVTGAIALLLSACEKAKRQDPTLKLPTAQQIMGALRTGIWDRGSGYGPLDVTALLQKFNVPLPVSGSGGISTPSIATAPSTNSPASTTTAPVVVSTSNSSSSSSQP